MAQKEIFIRKHTYVSTAIILHARAEHADVLVARGTLGSHMSQIS